MTQDPHIAVTRAYSGFAVEGQMFRLLFTAQRDGRIGVQCIVLPASTGWDRAARMGGFSDDIPSDFALSEIHLSADRIECLVGREYAPFYRAGFVIALEPGMHDAIAAVLPKIHAAVQLTQRLEEVTAAAEGDHGSVWSVFEGTLPGIVATAMFDGIKPATAVEIETEQYRQIESPDDAALAAFRALVERTLPRILEERTA